MDIENVSTRPADDLGDVCGIRHAHHAVEVIVICLEIAQGIEVERIGMIMVQDVGGGLLLLAEPYQDPITLDEESDIARFTGEIKGGIA